MHGWPRVANSGVFWIVVCYLLLMPVLFRPVLHGTDPVGYFSWLRSAVVDRDLQVGDEFEYLGLYRDYDYQNVTLPTGYRYNQWSSGPALLWSPFYGAYHAAAVGLQALGLDVPTNGYDAPYMWVTALTTTLYVLVAILLLYQVACRYAAAPVAALAVITLWAASSLIFYTFSSPFMSHAHDFFVGALFIWTWHRTRTVKSGWAWFWRGVCFGLAIFVRIQNVFLVVVPAVALTWSFWADSRGFSQRARTLLAEGLAFSVGTAVFLGPLMLFWKTVYGHWIYNTYAITNELDGIKVAWFQPHLFNLAFSNDHGLFFWSPVLLLGLVGLVWLARRDGELSLVLAGLAAIQFYFVSTLNTWNGGGPSFGARLLVGVLPVFAVGLAVFLNTLHTRLRARYLAAICAPFIVWNLLLVVQYALGTIARSGPLDPVELWWSQLRVVPDNVERIVTILLTRGG